MNKQMNMVAWREVSQLWLVDLRQDHINLPEQGPVTITVTDIQERVASIKNWIKAVYG